MNSKISIIIPVYNAERYLQQCINSLCNQTYKNIEVIVVNDGSTDGSEDILKFYEQIDTRIKIINKENGGVSNARNLGLKNISGEFLMFLDSDDWIEENTCEIVINEILENNADVVLWNYTREFDGTSKDKIIFDEDKIVFTDKKLDDLHRRFVGLYGEELSKPENADSVVPVWGKLYRVSTIKNSEAKFVDTTIVGTSEDALFNLQVFGFVRKAVYIKKCLYHYRKEDTSFTKKYKKNLVAQWKSLYEHMERYIVENQKEIQYTSALHNRISLSIIGLGMNLLRGEKQYEAVKNIINSKWYMEASQNLDIQYFPLYWKLFFVLVKSRCTLGVLMMLKCIKFLKGDRS